MFLEILTRTFNKRPGMLVQNWDSLTSQTCDDWEQTLLIDDVGRGVAWSTENMARYAPKLVGEYIWILDDDDLCIRNTLVAELKAIVARDDPDLIMLRMDHGAYGILPPNDLWRAEPERGQIGMSAFVAKRELWQMCAHVLIPGRYDGDFDMALELYDRAECVYWHDVVASRIQWVGVGRPERKGYMAKKKVTREGFWRYVGDGSRFIPGVPVRDLSMDESEQWYEVITQANRYGKLYEWTEAAKPVIVATVPEPQWEQSATSDIWQPGGTETKDEPADE